MGEGWWSFGSGQCAQGNDSVPRGLGTGLGLHDACRDLCAGVDDHGVHGADTHGDASVKSRGRCSLPEKHGLDAGGVGGSGAGALAGPGIRAAVLKWKSKGRQHQQPLCQHGLDLDLDFDLDPDRGSLVGVAVAVAVDVAVGARMLASLLSNGCLLCRSFAVSPWLPHEMRLRLCWQRHLLLLLLLLLLLSMVPR